MKTSVTYFSPCRQNRFFRLAILLCMFCPITYVAEMSGQDSLNTEKNEKFKSRINLSANQFPDSTIELNSQLRVKVDEVYQGVPDAKVTYYNLTPDGEEKSLGDKSTAANGKASLIVKTEGLTADADGYYSFIARFDGNDKLTSCESDLRIHPATLDIEAVEEDSAYKIKILATSNSPEGPLPIADAQVAVYVKRMFSSLKVGEGSTDEAGTAEIDFPNNLPGDQNANLVITAMIEESEDYGNLAASVTKLWGRAVNQEVKELPRALWSPLPPIWMVVTFFILMGTVWGNYCIIVYKLFRIRFKRIDNQS